MHIVLFLNDIFFYRQLDTAPDMKQFVLGDLLLNVQMVDPLHPYFFMLQSEYLYNGPSFILMIH